MPRPPRVQFPGAFYHVMSRGNAKQNIFLSRDDRLDFLHALERVVDRFSWVCHAYCLMENHYHLLIETPEANLSQGMQDLNGVYCHLFNMKYARVGHVTQGRFLSPLIEDDGYLLQLLRYISLNPVRSDLVRAPEQWKWSSYRAMAGIVPVPPFLEIGYILRLFSDDMDHARNACIRFVAEGLEEFTVNQGHETALEPLFRGVMDRQSRNRAISKAHLDLGFNAQEIADHLNLDISTVYRAIGK